MPEVSLGQSREALGGAEASGGNQGYRLAVPILHLPGRGLDLALDLVFNSKIWQQGDNQVIWDPDADWPRTRVEPGIGKLIDLDGPGCLLVEPGGAKHRFERISVEEEVAEVPGRPVVGRRTFNRTTDGTFIEYECKTKIRGSSTVYEGRAYHPHITVVLYMGRRDGSGGIRATSYASRTLPEIPP